MPRIVRNIEDGTITYEFEFLSGTYDKENLNCSVLEKQDMGYYTTYQIHVHVDNKEEIHSYFEKHYMDIVEFPSYSYCLQELIHDFIDIPSDFEIKTYEPIPGKPTSSIRVNTTKGDVWMLKDILMEHGITYKEGLYTIFRNVKEYYKRDENKARKRSLVRVLMDKLE